MKAKYIVIDYTEIIIFPISMTHDYMAKKFPTKPCTSAGFAHIGQEWVEEETGIGCHMDCNITYSCSGESQSLNLKSAEGDSRLLRRMFEDY